MYMFSFECTSLITIAGCLLVSWLWLFMATLESEAVWDEPLQSGGITIIQHITPHPAQRPKSFAAQPGPTSAIPFHVEHGLTSHTPDRGSSLN